MTIVTRLEAYQDRAGNQIKYDGPIKTDVRIKFTGSNNRLEISPRARVGRLTIDFDCDNGLVRIGPSSGVPAFSAAIRVGQDSKVLIGKNVSVTSSVAMSATEGTTIRVGEDVMFASENEVRADDGHPIFDVRTGQRVNISRSIVIGEHVWVARRAVLLGGARVGSGSVVGYGAVVKKRVPNNVVLAGVPARVVRRHIAWERPHLSLVAPYYKPDSNVLDVSSAYWHLTEDPASGPEEASANNARRTALTVRIRKRLKVMFQG